MQTTLDPGISEWGNPLRGMPEHHPDEYIVGTKRTEGTETSQYLQEEKVITISSVVANERERA